MKQENIKGQCEHCGVYFEGLVTLKDGAFPEDFKCPACGEPTQNFDSSSDVDERNEEEEGEKPVYTKFDFNKI